MGTICASIVIVAFTALIVKSALFVTKFWDLFFLNRKLKKEKPRAQKRLFVRRESIHLPGEIKLSLDKVYKSKSQFKNPRAQLRIQLLDKEDKVKEEMQWSVEERETWNYEKYKILVKNLHYNKDSKKQWADVVIIEE